MHSFHFGTLLHASFFNDRLATWTEPFNILDAWPAWEEDGRNGLIREVVLFTVGLQAWFDVEGSRAMVTADEFATIFTMITVIPVFNFWLCRLWRKFLLRCNSCFGIEFLILWSISLTALQNLASVRWLGNHALSQQFVLLRALKIIWLAALPIRIVHSFFCLDHFLSVLGLGRVHGGCAAATRLFGCCRLRYHFIPRKFKSLLFEL